jgi:hypothetical protein
MPPGVARIAFAAIAAHREGDVLEVANQAPFEQAADHIRQGQRIIGDTIRLAAAERAFQ